MKLGVNIDHVATLREARYRGQPSGEPDPVEAALICEAAGARGITAHLREDRRHIIDRDIFRLREAIKTRLNLEMAVIPEMVEIALRLRPDIVCLVPERRAELTTEGGLDAAAQAEPLRRACDQLKQGGIEISLFINPDLRQIEAAAAAGAGFVELHTGQFAEHFQDEKGRLGETERLAAAARAAHALGLSVNAGHGLNYQNVRGLFPVPYLEELNIGHSIVSRSITTGLATAVREMLQAMEGYPGSAP